MPLVIPNGGVAAASFTDHSQQVIRISLSVLLLLASSCGKQPPTASVVASSSVSTTDLATSAPASSMLSTSGEPVFYQAKAQTGLQRVKLLMGAVETQSEMCYTVTQIATGLMHRHSIGTNETLLFVFGTGQERSFYMRNVPFEIDVAYIDVEGVIQEIVRLKALDEKGVPSKSSRIQFVLEAAPGYFTRNGLGVGTLIQTDLGSLNQSLSRFAQLR